MYLSTGDVARKFGVTSATIRNWTEKGILKCERLWDGNRRYCEEDVEPILDAWNTYNEIFMKQERRNNND